MIAYSTRGPLFDGELDRQIVAGLTDAQRDVAGDAHRAVLLDFAEVLRTHPTGRLESHVRVRPVGSDFVVDDGGVVYGPWIEGVGSRNRTTRFKGYRTYRRVVQAVRDRAGQIARRAMARRIGGAA